MIEFGVLGPLTVRRDDAPVVVNAAMLRGLLALLLHRPGQPVSVDTIVESLWPGRPPATARKTVQVYVGRLRRTLGDEDRIRHGPGGYTITVAPGELDTARFRALVDDARDAHRRGEVATADATLTEALGLWRGTPFADLGGAGAMAEEIRLLEEQRLTALELRAAARLDLRRHHEVVADLVGLLPAYPYHERLVSYLMLALYRSDRQSEALDLYRRTRDQLADELGIEPGPAMSGLQRAILRNDGRLGNLGANDLDAITLPPPRPSGATAAASARAGAAPPPPSEVPAGRRSPLSRALTAAVVTALTLGLLGASMPAARPRMTGLFNIVLAPFAWSGPVQEQVASRLQVGLHRELRSWSDEVAAIQLRGPDRIEVVDPEAGPGRGDALGRVAREHGADVVVTARLHSANGRLTVAIELLITDRTFGETPEFVGLHDISITEPADVLARNLEINEELTEATLHYLKAVVAFVRGLGDYALDDFAGAEDRLLTADAEFDRVDEAAGHRTVRRDVLYLMLGNAVGRDDKTRLGQAADYYRLALSRNPAYTRARIGLAEATRAAAGCQPGRTRAEPLGHAIDDYSAALTSADGDDPAVRGLLRTKARLGLGLTYQCLTAAGLGDHWADADAEFREILRLRPAGRPMDGNARHSRLLAAEARAGQALTAFLTADGPGAARYGGYPAAAAAYEDALRLLGGMDVERPTMVERELVYLRNLRSVYRAMDAGTELRGVDGRISAATARLATMADSR
ncbi:AfsR/SARP family transcriptional regulator [Actinoplanes sp. NPDC049668]|uniref:AfsR/SARP family transcriptional regulator n=1 Tax=unclassified Actinoplanes TaxID=2626549 RepID=UPI0033A25B60